MLHEKNSAKITFFVLMQKEHSVIFFSRWSKEAKGLAVGDAVHNTVRIFSSQNTAGFCFHRHQGNREQTALARSTYFEKRSTQALKCVGDAKTICCCLRSFASRPKSASQKQA